jgi:hypothetical protein
MSFLIIIMENNNTEILSVLHNINENIKLVVEELKKSNENKMKNTPNLFDLFGGMNSPNDDDDEEDEEEESEEEESEEAEVEAEEEAEEEVEEKADKTK